MAHARPAEAARLINAKLAPFGVKGIHHTYKLLVYDRVAKAWLRRGAYDGRSSSPFRTRILLGVAGAVRPGNPLSSTRGRAGRAPLRRHAGCM